MFVLLSIEFVRLPKRNKGLNICLLKVESQDANTELGSLKAVLETSKTCLGFWLRGATTGADGELLVPKELEANVNVCQAQKVSRIPGHAAALKTRRNPLHEEKDQ